MRLAYAFSLLAPFAVFTAYGQSVISAHSGVVHYVEGDTSIEGKPVEMKFGHFPEIKPNEVFSTKDGRAEVLLAPGSFLRLAENSSVKMLSNNLTDTRFELLEGEILVESVDFTKDSAAAKTKGNVITVAYKGTTTLIDKPGLYQFTTSPARVRVFEGEALVKTASDQVTLKRGKETQLEGTLMAEKFDNKVGDELTRWSARRSGYLATANISAAHSMSSDSSNWSSYAGGYTGGWAFNPLFGMYTFVPMGGIGWSPFGFGYYSPYAAGLYYPYLGYGYYPGYGYGYYPVGATGGGGNSAGAVGGRRAGIGNVGGNSPIRASASNHVGGTPGYAGGNRGASNAGYSGMSAESGGFSRGGGSMSSGGGGWSGGSAAASSAGGGGARGGGGGGGGRGK